MSYAKGAARERQLQDQMEREGWVVTRSAGSRSPHDLHCSRAGVTRLVQVKTDASGPYGHFGPAERLELAATASRAGAVAYLVWWPARKQPQWIPAYEWPT